jgi:hypothetical protein
MVVVVRGVGAWSGHPHHGGGSCISEVYSVGIAK